jgi:hypothetical protein
MKRSYHIVIDDSVLLPSPRGGQSRTIVHPLPSMLKKLQVGESFLWPKEAATDFNTLRSMASKFGKKNQMKFVGRQIKRRDGTMTLRFWRTA